jgi:hypothetical protein
MPLKFGKKDVPEELAMETDAMDDAVGEELAGMTPKPDRPYSAKVMTALGKAISAVLNVMGVEAEAEAYTEPVPELDPEEVRFLSMLTAAAADYGKPLPVTPDKIMGDSELTSITAALMELAKDEGFREFLGEVEPGEEEEGMMEEPSAKMKPKGKTGMGESEPTDDFFAGRMRK